MLFFLFSHFSLLPWFVFLPSSAMLLRNLSFSCADRQVPLLFENMLLQFLQIAEENYIILKAVAQVPALNIHLLPFYSIPSCKELSPGWRTCFRGGRESYPCSQQSSVPTAGPGPASSISAGPQGCVPELRAEVVVVWGCHLRWED